MVFAVGGFCEFTVRSGVILIKKTKFLGPLYCILAAVIWGLSFVAQSAGGEKTGTFTFNGLRTLLGAIVLVPLVIVSFKKENSALPDGEKKKFPFKDVLIGGVCCGLPLFIGTNLQQYAFNFLDAGKVGFITALYMLLVPLFGLFLGQRCARGYGLALRSAWLASISSASKRRFLHRQGRDSDHCVLRGVRRAYTCYRPFLQEGQQCGALVRSVLRIGYYFGYLYVYI